MGNNNVETVYVCGFCREGRHHNCLHDLYLDDGGVAECACASEDHMGATLSWVCDVGNYWLVEVPAREPDTRRTYSDKLIATCATPNTTAEAASGSDRSGTEAARK